VSALIQNIIYENTDTINPTRGIRTIRFVLEDEEANVSDYNDMQIGGDLNKLPQIQNIEGDMVSYENTPVLIDDGSNAAVTDADSQNFEDGFLIFSITDNFVTGEDVLAIRNQGMSIGQIGFSGSYVFYESMMIGIFFFDSATGTLSVSLTDYSDTISVSALIQNITYENIATGTPTPDTRVIHLVMEDGDGGGMSADYEMQVEMPSPNEAPVIENLEGDTATYTEGDAPVLADAGSDALVTDSDSPGFGAGSLIVSITDNFAAGEDVLAIRNQGTGSEQIGISGSNVTYAGTLIGTFVFDSATGTLSVSFSEYSDMISVSALIWNITYENTDTDFPTPGTRTIRFVMEDGDGATSTAYETSVAVLPVNDAPDILNIAGDTATYNQGDEPVLLDAGTDAVVADPDSPSFNNGYLSAEIAAGFIPEEDVLSVQDGNGIFVDATSTIYYNGSTIATLEFDDAAGLLIVDFNSDNATADAVSALIHNISYENSELVTPTAGERTIRFQMNDGDGGDSVPQDMTLFVNDLPENIPTEERDALIALYNSTDGPNWIDSTNWLGTPGTECSWAGVTCDADGNHIQQLDLSGNNLNGHIPTKLENLTQLQELWLQGNQLNSVPIELTTLANVIPGKCNLCWNALDLSDTGIQIFIDSVHTGACSGFSTQTIAPSDFQVAEAAGYTAKLIWTPISYTADSGGYEVYYSAEPEGDYLWCGITADKSASSITVTLPEEIGGAYYFRIKAFTSPHADNTNTVYSEFTDPVFADLNRPPEISGAPETLVYEDAAYIFMPLASDPDGDSLSFSIVNLPAWASFDPATGTLSGTPENADVGTTSDILISVSDGMKTVSLPSFDITVVNTNDPPEFESAAISDVKEGNLYTYKILTTDPDVGDTRTVTAPTKPSWLMLSDNGDGTASLEGTPLNENVGTHEVMLEARDEAGEAVSQTFYILVENTNDLPEFTSTAITDAMQDQPYAYAITSSDPDIGDTREIEAPTLPAWLTLSDNGDGTAILSGTPAKENAGENKVELIVKDAAGASDTQSFVINAQSVNDTPPVFSSTAPVEAEEDAVYTYRITTNDPDIGDIPAIEKLAIPAWLSLTDHGDGTATLTGTPDNADVGNHEIRLQTKDGDGFTDSQSFTITVANVNDAPMLDNSEPMELAPTDEDVSDTLNPGTTVSELVASSGLAYPISDADADAMEGIAVIGVDRSNGIWQYDEDRNGLFAKFPEDTSEARAVLLDETSVIRFIPNPDFNGRAEITFRAWDQSQWRNGARGVNTTANGGTTPFSTAIQVASITVMPINDTPTISGDPLVSVNEDSEYDFMPTAEDIDVEDMLTFSVSNKPDWAEFDTDTGRLHGTPDNTHVGTTSGIGILVSDGTETTALKSFDITVANTNDLPTISGDPAPFANENDDYLFVPIADDPDAEDTLTFSVENLPSWASFDTTTGGLSGTPGNNDVGIFKNILISVSDGTETIRLPLFAIQVIGVNDAPVITGQNPLEAFSDKELSIHLGDLKVSDPDNTYPEDFSLTIHDGENYTHTNSSITPVPGFIGMLSVPVTVNDGANDSNRFVLSVSVSLEVADDDGLRQISGTVTGLEPDREIWVHALSWTLKSSQVIRLIGIGDSTDYVITDLEPSHDYQVEISSNDYPYQVYNRQHQWENATLVDISESDASGIDFAFFPPTGMISGEITFPQDASPGETVHIYAISHSAGADRTTTVTLGDDLSVPFAISELPQSSDYIVFVQADAYKNRYYDGTETGTKDEAHAKFVDTQSPEAGAVNFLLDPGMTISGTILGDDISGIVKVWSEQTRSGGEVVILENGDYEVSGLEYADDFIVKVSTDDGVFFYSDTGTVRNSDLATFVNIEDADSEKFDITTDRGEVIQGKLENEDGEPLANVWVSAWSPIHGIGNGTFSNEDGTYELDGLLSGEDYTLSVLPDASSGYEPHEISGVSIGDMADMTFVLESEERHTLGGRITDINGEYIPNVSVEIWSESQKFHSWSAEDMSGAANLHIEKPYEIFGLPAADDYVIEVRPPKDSPYAVFSETEISISGDTARNIVLMPGITISGIIRETGGAPVVGAQILLRSDSENFRGEAISDKHGFYEIPNAPDVSDYVITILSDDHMIMEIPVTSPGSGTDFDLETRGTLSGLVIYENGAPSGPDIPIEVWSASVGDMPESDKGFMGAAVTDKNGAYEIRGLKTAYGDGTPVEDYVITAYPKNRLPLTETGHGIGDTVNFVIPPEISGNMLVSGTVTDAQGNPLDDVLVDIFENQGDFVMTKQMEPGGSFSYGDLSPDGLYQLRFIAFLENGEELVQWAGEGDIGFEAPDSASGENPENAKAYAVGDLVSFRFSESQGGQARSSLSHSERSDAPRVRNLRSAPSEITTLNPEVSVTWEPSESDADERYYHLFSNTPDSRISKRNAPRIRPLSTTRLIGQNFGGDDIPYYVCVAPVDQRGRIGDTEVSGFRVDTVPPVNALATAPDVTLFRDISLTLGATGAAKMYVSNMGYGKGGTWENPVRQKEWQLTDGEGMKKVYVQFRDRSGNISNAMAVTERLLSMPNHFTITATAEPGGSIEPAGEILVGEGDARTFAIMPDSEYEILAVRVDGEPVALAGGHTYTFENVTKDSSISVSFRAVSLVTHSITAFAGPNGSITPSGEVVVNDGDDLTLVITPDPGYAVDEIRLDGRKVRLADGNTYRFINVPRDYELSVTFKPEN